MRSSYTLLTLVGMSSIVTSSQNEAVDPYCLSDALTRSMLNTYCTNEQRLCGPACLNAHNTYISILETTCNVPNLAIPFRQVVNQCLINTQQCGSNPNEDSFWCTECGFEYLRNLRAKLQVHGVTDGNDQESRDDVLKKGMAVVRSRCASKERNTFSRPEVSTEVGQEEDTNGQRDDEGKEEPGEKTENDDSNDDPIQIEELPNSSSQLITGSLLFVLVIGLSA
eukprot:TRINITY_DN5574_c0_g1_i1.p1 TRINITY_DN5574_c0_g1~~TRINITY_DN5574_c0_g1_i1.p1  ORF type:complete len:224 (-),score=6.50 TRINITY_DN5574_c0_g1_i1:44-715(-)